MPRSDSDFRPLDIEPAPPRSQRLAAVCAVALIVLSCGLLQGLSQGVRPIQSVGWIFGPTPAADRF